MKIIFAGTPPFAATHLQSIIDHGQHEVLAVYTQPDRPAGRGKKLTASAVKLLAEKYNLPLFQPQSLKTSEQQQLLTQHGADLMVVVAYGLLLPQADGWRISLGNVRSILSKNSLESRAERFTNTKKPQKRPIYSWYPLGFLPF